MAADNTNPGARGSSPASPAVKNAQEGAAGPRQAGAPKLSPQAQEPKQGAGITRRESYSPAPLRDVLSLSPFGLMSRMMEDMDQLFTDFAGGGLGLRGRGAPEGGLWSPQVDVLERDGNLLVRADLPGMKQEDIRVEVLEDLLVIEGERAFEQEGEEDGIWSMERGSGSFRRAIPLPEGIETETAQAHFENGVLEVSLKLPQARSEGKRIEVKGGSRPTQKKPVH